ncbi:MAG TPA: SMC family ATPase, partial [Chthonomonadales bacterium]|nr:SMC family ATPase [Chthonomonadales bacterium]
MIPLQLTVRNFMSYGPEGETLPLRGARIACLSGDNGNGKSALLDAISWALWGKTRGSAVKSITEDDLIRVGADEMEVRYEFELDGNSYHVARRRKRGKPGGDWTLSRMTGDSEWSPMTSGTRDTGAQLQQLLGMDYETFLNSAYLQQGRADEFTRQTPDNRKRILGEVLGLGKYDLLADRCREKHRESKAAADELERELRLLDAEAELMPQYQAQLAAAQSALAEATAASTAREVEASTLHEQRSKLDAVAAKLASAQEEKARLEQTLAEREAEVRGSIAQVAAWNQVLARKEAIVADYEALQSARSRRDLLEPQIETMRAALAERDLLSASIDIEKTRLEGERAALQVELTQARERAAEQKEISARIQAVQVELQKHGDLAQRLDAARTELESARQRFEALSARNHELERALKEMDEVLVLLDLPRSACPVCESDLSGPRRAAVIEKQRGRREDTAREKDDVRKRGQEEKRRLAQCQQSVSDLEQANIRRVDLEAQVRSLQKQEADLQRSVSEADIRRKVEALEATLRKEEFALARRAKRRQLEQDIARLQPVCAEHESVLARIKRLDGSDTRFHELQSATGNRARELDNQDRLALQVASTRADCEKTAARIEGMRQQLAGYNDVKERSAD